MPQCSFNGRDTHTPRELTPSDPKRRSDFPMIAHPYAELRNREAPDCQAQWNGDTAP
jgi:hypothetical protein